MSKHMNALEHRINVDTINNVLRYKNNIRRNTKVVSGFYLSSYLSIPATFFNAHIISYDGVLGPYT